ncbi:MAG TPA: twin-arginine translocation signal domain-containing protein [Pseudolabrys sp.]
MKQQDKMKLGRRDFLRAMGAGAGLAATAAGPLVEEAKADTETNTEKRKVRYQASSPDVKNFYRVNSYPR